MSWVAGHLYLIPLLPLVAAGLTAVCRRRHRGLAAGLAISAMSGSFVLSVLALAEALSSGRGESPNLQAAAQQMAAAGADEILLVGSDGAKVRMWIDERAETGGEW